MPSTLASIFTATKQLQGDPSLTGTDQSPDSAGGLLNSAISLFGKGADIYTGLTNKGTATVSPSGQVTAPAATASASSWKTYLPWIGGGLAVVLVLYFVLRKS